MKIAYQGELNSNSEFAARQLCQLRNLTGATLQPARTSARVVEAVASRSADYGVVARSNSTLGEVEETRLALESIDYLKIDECSLPIHHALFFANSDVDPQDVTHVYSHPQALGQCANSLKRLVPNAVNTEAADTSFAAQQLATGQFSSSSAVVCRLEAGTANGLHLHAESIEDVTGNATCFWLISLRPSNIRPQVGVKDRFANWLCRPLSIKLLITLIVAILIFTTTALNANFGWSAWTVFSTIAGFVSTSILAITSPKFVEWAQHRRVLGYWQYRPIPSRDDAPTEEVHHIDRVVVIDRIDGELRFRGWQAGDGENHRWESASTLSKHRRNSNGQLVYEYKNTHSHKQSVLAGIVSLYWSTTDPAQSVNSMTGFYYGYGAKQDDGRLVYARISESKFERLRFHGPSGIVDQ